MERITADFETIWENMSAEQRQIYGRQYIDRHIAFADTCRGTARMDISPVILAMTDALFAVRPQARYMVHGGAGRFDLFCVSCCYLAFCDLLLLADFCDLYFRSSPLSWPNKAGLIVHPYIRTGVACSWLLGHCTGLCLQAVR